MIAVARSGNNYLCHIVTLEHGERLFPTAVSDRRFRLLFVPNRIRPSLDRPAACPIALIGLADRSATGFDAKPVPTSRGFRATRNATSFP
jgi:hypothetical protein